LLLNACSFHLAAVGGALQLTRGVRPVSEPAAGQVLIRIGAASLNHRDLLIQKDPTSNRDGLIPLSDGAGTVAAIGPGVTRWRVSANFFPTWRAGAFSASAQAIAIGGG
jgi:NADPH:quinone reductase-like Zn-dependent oxidoreductase